VWDWVKHYVIGIREKSLARFQQRHGMEMLICAIRERDSHSHAL